MYICNLVCIYIYKLPVLAQTYANFHISIYVFAPYTPTLSRLNIRHLPSVAPGLGSMSSESVTWISAAKKEGASFKQQMIFNGVEW